jgi:type III secretory pathway component EscS
MTPQMFRIVAFGILILLLYGGRLVRGKARETAAGVIFPMKALVIASRLGIVVLYLGFLVWMVRVQGHAMPFWVPLLFVVAVGFLLMQMPSTIVLGPEALTQSFWFLKQRQIRYDQVMMLRSFAAGRAIRVLGDNQVTITHTNNHADGPRFLAEMERRTGKKAS